MRVVCEWHSPFIAWVLSALHNFLDHCFCRQATNQSDAHFLHLPSGGALVSQATASSGLETEERMSEPAGTALEMKGDTQNGKLSKDYLRTFHWKLSEEPPGSPLLAETVPAEERGSL